MMKKFLILGFMIVGCLCSTQAQNVLKGRVTDKDGNPIAGAKVENAKGSEQTTTDMNGQFALETQDPVQKVNVYYMGMQTARKKAKPDMLVEMSSTSWWNEKPDKYQWFVGVQMAMPNAEEFTPSFGLMVGRVKNFGWYARGVVSKIVSADSYTQNSSHWTTGETKSQYLAGFAGGVARLGCPIYAYLGVGAASRKVLWEYANGEEREHEADRYVGIGIDLGVMVRCKRFFVNAGGNMCAFLTTEYDTSWEHTAVANVGIGMYF